MIPRAPPQTAKDACVTVGGAERLDPVAATLGSAFNEDATMRIVTRKLPEKERLLHLPMYLRALAKGGALNDGRFYEVGEYGAAGLLNVIRTYGWRGPYRGLTDFEPATKKIRKRIFHDSTNWYYLWLLATRPDRQGQGLASRIVNDFQALAQIEGRPVYLETSSARARRLYEHLGFKVEGEFVFGQGNSDKDGYAEEGGSGVLHWAMVWRPKSYDSLQRS